MIALARPDAERTAAARIFPRISPTPTANLSRAGPCLPPGMAQHALGTLNVPAHVNTDLHMLRQLPRITSHTSHPLTTHQARCTMSHNS
jgi:hypothetical protein